MRATIDYGIDLGTSNSAIAVQDGATPRLLPAEDGSVLMPSAIHVRLDGTVCVGDEAKRLRSNHPEDTAVEFKRQMGTAQSTLFPASGRRLSSEEMSGEILRALANRAERAEGHPLRAAVITVPAMFQLAQCEATRRAAALAGIEHAPLLQEPIAAAIAHSGSGHAREGHWLVYDLGGGTFDVSLVRSRAGRLQVLDHDGNNHLGGKDFDRVLARWAAERIREEGIAGEFRRTDPALASTFVRLAAEAERVRVALSDHEQVTFEVPDLTGRPGDPVSFRKEVDRELLESLLAPTIASTIDLCQQLLARNRLEPSGLKGIVLVGGPTRTPALPRIIEQKLGHDARHLMDPTTIVAAGAALFASTQKLPPAFRSGPNGRSTVAVSLELEYESMTTNPSPLLVGKATVDGGPQGVSVRVVRQDQGGGFDSGAVALSAQSSFAIPLVLRKSELNIFQVEATRNGSPIDVEPSRFSILHGMSVAKPPLSQSVGVMLADNSVCWYLRKGAVLPTRNTVTHATTVPLKRGESGEPIRVPLLQGESDRADRNKIIGVLCIHARDISRDLPAGTEIEVTLAVDEFSRTEARGYVPLLDRWFDEIVEFETDEKSAEQVNQDLTTQQERLKLLEQQAAELEATGGSATRPAIDERVREVESLIAEGDRDSVELAEQMVRLMTHQIDRVESVTRTDGLRVEFAKHVENTKQFLTEMGRKDELDALAREFQGAMSRGDVDAAEAKHNSLVSLTNQLWMQTIDYWIQLLNFLHSRFTALNLMALAGSRFDQGVAAANNNDIQALAKVCMQLIDLLPREERGKMIEATGKLTSTVQ